MIGALLPVAMDVARGLASSSSVSAPASATAGADFGQALAAAAGDAMKTMRSAESVSMSGIQGKVSVQQVTESVMQAERTLQTAVAIRDKAVAAYQQISQMQI